MALATFRRHHLTLQTRRRHSSRLSRNNQSVALATSSMNFQLYSSGVVKGECGTEMDHGDTVVGYGTTSDGTKYWLVENS
ncbi:hypothetical protein AMTR_s00021p00179030 [Amborella trichopoda]|uniref:Peptidase C1A papain C-terminal domain-containing protein n=1 Tax=Amborella trichopoda TaxID=13333 RepID=W1Q107_AMBTC|nr:hypothetical protein AMTR_s00021p00179030 [Amborella trichopoda]